MSSCDPSTSHNNNNSRDCHSASRESRRKTALASFATVYGETLLKKPNATETVFIQGGDVTARLSEAADTLRWTSTSKPRACDHDVAADSGELETEPRNLCTDNTMLRHSTDTHTTASTSGNDYKNEDELDEAGDEALEGRWQKRSYCREEDMLILRFLLDTRRWREVSCLCLKKMTFEKCRSNAMQI